METSDSSQQRTDESIQKQIAGRLVYLVPADAELTELRGGRPDLAELWGTIWTQRWLIVAITSVFVAVGITYSLLATHWYQADVTLAPADEESLPAALGQFAGLASLAGMTVPASGSTEAVATLRSRAFAAEFINDRGLMPVLFADEWDPETVAWRRSDRAPRLGDAVKYFLEAVLRVSEQRQTGLVVLSVRWTDPALAAEWANDLVRRVNERLRKSAVSESERNIAFLKDQVASNVVVPLQQSASRVLESELQKLMLAKGNEEFAFKVIDPATVPLLRFKPQRTLITLLSAIVGGILALVVVLIRGQKVNRKAHHRGSF